MWKNKIYFLGGQDYKNQISVLNDENGCSLHRIGELNFNYDWGACASTQTGDIYMCFDNANGSSEHKVCRRASGPLEKFEKIADSKSGLQFFL